MNIPWKKIGKFLIGTVAPAAASSINPMLGVIVNGIVNGVIDSSTKTDLTNDQKKENAIKVLSGLAGDIDKAIKDAGLILHDPERFNSGLDAVMEGIIDVLKATSALPKSPTTSAIGEYLPAQVLITQAVDGTMNISIKSPN